MLRTVLFAIGTIFFITACSSNSVKKDEMFEVMENLRETATVQMGTSTDGFTRELPKGSKIKAVFSTTPAATYFDCIPVEVNGNTDPDQIEQFFVPETMRMAEDYQGFTYTLPIEYIGTKLKKIE